MKLLITGGAGFIGSNLTRYLINKGHKICVVDDLSAGKKSNLLGLDVDFIEGKIEEIDIKNINGIDFIIHLAAQASVPLSIENFYESSSKNLLSSIKVFEIARKYKIPVIYASSSAVYGNLPIGNDISALVY